MKPFTHRSYYQRFNLNVAQYGEILVAGAFDGVKMGDTQRGYDIKTTSAKFQNALESTGIEKARILSSYSESEIKLQVRTKLLWTASGRASVVHCKDSDLELMSHLVVVLVHSFASNNRTEVLGEVGQIFKAWLLTRQSVRMMRRIGAKSQRIAISDLEAKSWSGELIDITTILNRIADAPLS